MDKSELTARIARRSRQSRGTAADQLDTLIYKLWKESRYPKPKLDEDEKAKMATAPVKKS